jgi:hypothetical protein
MSTATRVAAAKLANSETLKQTEKINSQVERNLSINQQQLQEQGRQLDAATTQKLSMVARAAQDERARIATVAGEAGATGNTQARLSAVSQINEDMDAGVVNENRINQGVSSFWQGKALEIQAESSMVDAPNKALNDLEIAGLMLPVLSRAPNPQQAQRTLTGLAGGIQKSLTNLSPNNDYYSQIINGALGIK